MESQRNIPRVVIAATGSGVGKTTVTVALIAALRARGMRVSALKCGPDYLDPTYHARVLGRPSQNLDSWMMGREAISATLAHAAQDADIAVIEGMMGLFDGAAPTSDDGSTAEIAKWLDAPVILVLDASGIARTVCAVAAGFTRFDSKVHMAGLICNRVGGRGHLDLLRQAQPEAPVLGGFPDKPQLAFPERHLGLLSATETAVADDLFAAWERLASEWLDLDAIVAIACAAPPLAVPASSARAGHSQPRCQIAIAHDEAFHFYYEDNLRRLEELGAELVRFSPCRDIVLPRADGLYFGGGYPEAHASALAANSSMLAAIRAFAADGGPIYAECGGLMYLCEAIRTLDGRQWPMASLLPGVAVMQPRLQALGYVEVETRAETFLGAAGIRFRGHQFRYSALEATGGSIRASCSYRVTPRWGGGAFDEGFTAGNVVASYVHAHWASNPGIARGLVAACESFRKRR
ncbi:MAG TPA: cobyrinate a,c-diamide synthase [Candidatus Binataceae bacterium]|nr:cobyrinate a,c-diamide synthase [Candidatus Binataceae bacterium]